MREKCDNMEGNSNWVHPFPKVLGYKRGSEITKGDIYGG